MSFYFFCQTESQSFKKLQHAIDFLHETKYKLYYDYSSKSYSKTLIMHEELHEDINTIISKSKFPHDNIKKPVIIAFKSTIGNKKCKIFWKNTHRNYNVFEIDQLGNECLTEFCQYEIINGFNYVKLDPKKELTTVKLENLRDKYKSNLLILAVKRNVPELVQKLLNYEFNINHEDCIGKNAMDYACDNYLDAQDDENKENSSTIIEALLKANSKLPKTKNFFKTNTMPGMVQKMLNLNKSLRDLIKAPPFNNLKKKLSENRHLHHFYDIKNQSILAFAYFINNLEAISILTSFGIRFGEHEIIEKYYAKISKKKLVLVRNINVENAYRVPEAHVLTLLKKTRIGRHNDFTTDKWESIKDAYYYLNSIPACSVILKTAAAWKKLKIVLDFSHTSTSLIDPNSSNSTSGIIYDSGIVIIGAKHLLVEDHRLEVIGTLIHELYHCAILITFGNVFDPYPVNDADAKEKYDNIFKRIEDLCKTNKQVANIVQEVFTMYKKNLQHSELIVRTIQILVQYSKDESMIKNNRKLLYDLFDFHEQIVLPACEEATTVLKKLNSKNIKYEELTNLMKTKILHAEILFQGVQTTFDTIFGDDHQKATEILNNLPVDDMRKLLIDDNEPLKFFDSLEVHEIINRKFVECTSFTKITPDAEKFYILADTAGSGKTAMIKKFAYDLKTSKNSSFVALIKLPDCYDITNQHHENSSTVDVLAVLFEIFKPQHITEKAILTYLYSISKIIFLFDGVDKIYPDLKENFGKILKHLKECTDNQIWVSTRPHLVADLHEQFGGKVYRFAPLTKKEKTKFMRKMLACIEQPEVITCLINFFQEIECFKGRSIDNFGMIESIVQVLCAHKDKFSIDWSNCTKIFDKVIQKYADKVNYRHKPAHEIKGFTQERVHRVFALENVLHKELIQEMCIVKNWKHAQCKWLVDYVQRHGIITAEHNNQNSNLMNDFLHKIYAEYYVAQHISSFLYDPHYEINEDEFRKVYNILKFIASSKNEFQFIHNFLLSTAAWGEDDNDGIFDTMQKVILDNMSSLCEEICDDKYLISFWTEIFKNDKIILENFESLNVQH